MQYSFYSKKIEGNKQSAFWSVEICFFNNEYNNSYTNFSCSTCSWGSARKIKLIDLGTKNSIPLNSYKPAFDIMGLFAFISYQFIGSYVAKFPLGLNLNALLNGKLHGCIH